MKFNSILLTGLLLSFITTTLSAQIYHVEPPNWWAGMKSQNLQLLVHGKDVGETTPILTFPGIVIQKVNQADSKNYLFLEPINNKATKERKPNFSCFVSNIS